MTNETAIRTDYLPLLLKTTSHEVTGGVYDKLNKLTRDSYPNQRSIQQAKELLEATYLLDVERVKHNAEVHAHNNALKDAIIQQMLDLGFGREVRINRNPQTGRETKKRYTQKAPWLEGIEWAFSSKRPDIRYLVVTQGHLIKLYDEMRRIIEKQLEQYTQQAKAQQRQNEMQEKQRQELITLTKLCIKYGVDDINPYALQKELYKRNHRLELAFAMLDARNDFQQGHEVWRYLQSFEIKNDTDKAIAENVQDAINSFNHDPDGRYFRDCTWNYDEIFTLINKDLLSDAHTVYAMVSDY